MRQAELELRYAKPYQGEFVHGTVQRHRLYSDANGRWLKFSLVEGDSRILCGWGVEGQVQRQFIHGKRYAVMGVVTRDDLQLVLVRYRAAKWRCKRALCPTDLRWPTMYGIRFGRTEKMLNTHVPSLATDAPRV